MRFCIARKCLSYVLYGIIIGKRINRTKSICISLIEEVTYMPVTEYIDGIECVFPKSKENSFCQFANLVAEALYQSVMRGTITLEELEELTKD